MNTIAKKLTAVVAIAAFTLMGATVTPDDAGRPEARNLWCC